MHPRLAIKFEFYVLDLVLGEKEDDSYLVLEIVGKALWFNLITKTFHMLHDFPVSRYYKPYRVYTGLQNVFQFKESLYSFWCIHWQVRFCDCNFFITDWWVAKHRELFLLETLYDALLANFDIMFFFFVFLFAGYHTFSFEIQRNFGKKIMFIENGHSNNCPVLKICLPNVKWD